MSDIIGNPDTDEQFVFASDKELRDYFAAHAMNAMLSHSGSMPEYIHLYAERAYVMADAMMKVRNK